MRQKEGALVKEVIEKPIGNRRLRRDGFERGVGIDHAGGAIETGIADAPEADLAVVAGNIFDEPLDGVMGVGAFVNALSSRSRLRPDVLEGSLGHIAAAHVLINEDIAFFKKVSIWPETLAKGVVLIGLNAIWRAHHQDGARIGGIFRRIHDGIQPYAVTHGYLATFFSVVFTNELGGVFGNVRPGRRCQGHAKHHCQSAEALHPHWVFLTA